MLRWISNPESGSKGQHEGKEGDMSSMKLRKFAILDGRLEDDVVQVARTLPSVHLSLPTLLSALFRLGPPQNTLAIVDRFLGWVLGSGTTLCLNSRFFEG